MSGARLTKAYIFAIAGSKLYIVVSQGSVYITYINKVRIVLILTPGLVDNCRGIVAVRVTEYVPTSAAFDVRISKFCAKEFSTTKPDASGVEFIVNVSI